MKLVKYMIPLILVAVAWILVAESVFITTTTKSLISKADDIHNDHEAEEEGHHELFIQKEEEPTTRKSTQQNKREEEEEEEEKEEKEALLRFDRSVAELFAKNIFGTETFEEEFSKITRLFEEEMAKIEDKRVKKLCLEKDIHIPDISVEDKQLLSGLDAFVIYIRNCGENDHPHSYSLHI